ncbi:MAG: metallophosphoesterase [Solirubrobacteraceae bacterium]
MTRLLVVSLVILATLAGAVTALATFRIDRDLDVGSVRLSVDPGHRGSLDLYVPLVDWGVRFPVVRLPARVNVDVRSIDRDAVVRLADSGTLDAQQVREQARAALTYYLRLAILAAALSALALGVLVALAVRGGAGPRLSWTLAVAVAATLAIVATLVVLLPPRSNVDSPQYYANGPEVPAALRTLESLGASAQTLDDEIDRQLVGIARLVTAPANRAALGPRIPRLTVASDLHNNVIALPALESAARGGPLLFTGDLTDRGSALERALVLRIVRAGGSLVFVAGNHDSDVLERQLARAGAVVLTRRGRLNADGSTGALVARVGGLRIVGYDDPLKRLARDDYEDRGATPSEQQQDAFTTWFEGVRDDVDVVMVHAPPLARRAVEALRADPPAAPLVVVWGHTHTAELQRTGPLTTLNPGSLGGGGTGKLAEGGGDIGLARLIYSAKPRFAPLAADLVQIDPGNGSAQAQRHRLDEPAETPR